MYLAALVVAVELAVGAASTPGPDVPVGNPASPAPDRGQEPPKSPGGLPEIAQQVFFEDGAAQIKPTSLPALEAIAAEIKAHPETFPLVALDGHAAPNERGPMRLSLSRATAVRLALIARGVDGARLLERVSGATAPLCEHSRDICWERERRVEFAILHPSPSPEAAAPQEKEKPARRERGGSAGRGQHQAARAARAGDVRAGQLGARRRRRCQPLDLVAGFLKANPTSLEIEGYAAEGERGRHRAGPRPRGGGACVPRRLRRQRGRA